MKAIFTRKEFALAVACALAFGLLSEMASAQVGPDEHAIVMDSSGVPVTSGFGLCLRSGFGPAPFWNAKCHGELPVPIAQGVAPVAALAINEKVVFEANVLFDSDKSTLRLLSEERVDAVKAYLVGKGIAAQRVQTSARGETRPSTQVMFVSARNGP